jgi:hypothetical protein
MEITRVDAYAVLADEFGELFDRVRHTRSTTVAIP